MPANPSFDINFMGNTTGAVGRFAKLAFAIKDFNDKVKFGISLAEQWTRSWRDIQQAAFETSRTIGLSRDQAMAYDRVLMQSAKALGRQYGITYKDLAKWQEEYVERTGRAIIMNRQQQEAMAQMARLSDSTTAVQMADEMNRFGASVEDAALQMAGVQERAKAMGLSTKTASEALAKNVHLASTYQFKNGIDGLQKMLLTSQSLRVNMESIVKAADGFQTIEGAIEKSAQLQMLGGTFAQQFSDPMTALFESLNDIGSFEKRIEKAVSGKGVFDKKTGEVRISGLDQQFIKAAADALGMDRQELTNMAMSKAKEGEVNAVIDRNAQGKNFNETQRKLIQSKSRWDAEQQTFVIDQFDKWGNKTESVAVDKMSMDQLKAMQDSNLTEEKLWSDVHDIKGILDDEFMTRARGTTSTNENLQGLKGEWDAAIAQIQNTLMSPLGSWMFNGANFQPWDMLKWFTGGPGAIPEFLPFASGHPWGYGMKGPFGNGGPMFANGGIVESEPVKAQFGAMIPGSSYSGDKVPVMANSGEMILNQQEQSGLWNTIKNLATTAGMAYVGHKIGSKFGLKGMGLMMGLQGLSSGGNMSLGQMAGSLAGTTIGGLAAKRMFGKSLTTSKLLGNNPMGAMGMMGGMFRPQMPTRLTLMNPVVYMAGNIVMNGEMGGGMLEDAADMADVVGGRKGGRGLRLGARARLARMKAVGRYNALKGKVGITKFGALRQLVKAKGALKGLSGALGKAIPGIGAALSVLGAVGGIASANSQYSERERAIENSGMSEREKARAKDEAIKDRNSGRGKAVGSSVGAIAGGFLGSVFGPLGTIAGGAIGSMIGGGLGSVVGGLFGGNNEDKFKDEDKVKAGYANMAASALTGTVYDIKTILSDMRLIMKAGGNERSSLVPKPIGEKTYVSPVVSSVGSVYNSPEPLKPQDINLNVSGTIRLDGGNMQSQLNMDELMKNSQFVNAITDIVVRRMSENANGGKFGREYSPVTRKTK